MPSYPSKLITRRSSGVCDLLAIAFLVATSSAPGQQPDPGAGNEFFSGEQVVRGERSFERECIDCHELVEFIGSGAYFDEQEGETIWSIFEFIWAEMPEDKPAWLDPDEYADILAYLLDAYGLPSGNQDMSIEQRKLETINLSRPR